MSATLTQNKPAATAPRSATRGWLFGPWFDLLFVANLAWPLIAFAQVGDDFGGRPGVQFWQLYYVTTPHRWITLFIVFFDRERFAQKRWTFLVLLVGVTVGCIGVRITTGALTCLLTIDYIWNAWHFAAQHHGVYRLYQRLGGVRPTAGVAVEKWVMRLFLLYVAVRVALATRPDAGLEETLWVVDWIAAALPGWLIFRAVTRQWSGARGGLVYLLSVSGLYLGLLWAVHERRLGLALSLATASALFHAIEYLSLVTWMVRRRHASGGTGLLAYFVPRWGATLVIFMTMLGAVGWLMDQRLVELWLLVNVVIAFLHYAYDGLIWRRSSL
ncbi:hypothetical protein [Fimbriiglobus ruber]|uniref:Uncharacterized protein n=1 Tax=Fimbriiglobus ruber TaxID=1908690 RepID=A0A225EFT2_9BACT|nr:hypothetical protein [Fimbriiglobus ruber]OWK47097.1 hypothetical protein FRUB_00796 [Fimbriiglobus ruber]